MTEPSHKETLTALAPYLLATLALGVAISLAMVRFAPAFSRAPTPVVSFDVIKYANSQRAVASALIKNSGDSNASDLLLNLSAKTKQAIAEVAGKDTLVVVRQTVVQGAMADITDAVLKKLDMPTNVPTQNETAAVLEYAPTGFATPPDKSFERRGVTAPTTGDSVLP